MVVIYWFINDFFILIFDMIYYLSEWFFQLVNLIVSCVTFLFDLVLLLHTSFTISSVALIAVAIIYKILGREGQD